MNVSSREAARQPTPLPHLPERRPGSPPAASGRPSRRSRHQQADYVTLLAAARAVFAERGLQQASIRDIARRAGFSVGGVYQFFRSKDDLYLAVVDMGWTQFRSELRQALRSKDCVAQLEVLTEMVLKDCDTRPGPWHILDGIQRGLPSAVEHRIRARLMTYLRHVRGVVVRIIRRGVQQGVFRTANVELLASSYGGIVRQVVFDALVLGTAIPTADVVLAMFLNGALRPGSRR